MVVINGPRFSSRAESLWHQQAGWTVVGMTGMPEAAIARELAMCFSTLCLVTDHDAGVDGGEAVTHEEVLRVFARSLDGVKALLKSAISAMPSPEDDISATCPCRRSLDGLKLPFACPDEEGRGSRRPDPVDDGRIAMVPPRQGSTPPRTTTRAARTPSPPERLATAQLFARAGS